MGALKPFFLIFFYSNRWASGGRIKACLILTKIDGLRVWVDLEALSVDGVGWGRVGWGVGTGVKGGGVGVLRVVGWWCVCVGGGVVVVLDWLMGHGRKRRQGERGWG